MNYWCSSLSPTDGSFYVYSALCAMCAICFLIVQRERFQTVVQYLKPVVFQRCLYTWQARWVYVELCPLGVYSHCAAQPFVPRQHEDVTVRSDIDFSVSAAAPPAAEVYVHLHALHLRLGCLYTAH